MADPHFIVGAYASLPLQRSEQSLYYALLGEQAWIDGAELPFPGDLAKHDDRDFLAKALPKHWAFNTVTLIPGTMRHVGVDADFGLASPNSNGRMAALDFTRQARDAILDLANSRGSNDVAYLEIHSAPTAHASATAMSQSVEELLSWDWAGTRLVIEHCDAYVEGQTPEKGFLPIDEEIDLCAASGIGLTVNWGRSCLEGRDAGTPEDHIGRASEAGVLTGLMFSGASDRATDFGGAWADGHLPMWPDESASLMNAERVAICAQMARECPGLEYMGAKVCVPASDSLPARMDRLARIREAGDPERRRWMAPVGAGSPHCGNPTTEGAGVGRVV